MDRSWMSKDRMSREYEEGVEYFINFALEHCPNQSGIRCPCMRCGNLIHHTPNKIREHMFFNGIDQVIIHVQMVHVIDDEFMTDPMSFKKLLEDAEKPLYPGCIKFTKLSALVKLYNVKARYGWSDKSFSDLLQILGDMLPVNNEMPLSMYEAKKTLNALGMEYKKIHACPNDCILYRNELNDASSCPTCGTSRWKVNKVGARNTKRIPAKVLWYFPPIPRFKRMFQSPKIAKDLKWHAKDCRNLRLAISADGINPHSSMTRPRQPGKDIDVYLAPLVDDLKALWEVGVKAYDAHQREFFTLKAILLWTINDFPAYGNLSGCTVKGYHACPICGKTKDGVKSRLDLLEMGLRPGLAPTFGLKRTYLPPACYTLRHSGDLCLLEKYFPPSIFDIMLHLTVHLVREVRLCGPVYMRWMYPFERVFIGHGCNWIPSSMKDEWKCGKPLLGGRAITIHDYKLVEQAHHYVLQNTTIVQPFIDEHMKYLKTKYPRQSKRVKWLEDEHVRTFSYWLRKKVSDDISKKELIENELKWLAQGPRQQVLTYPGYIINGCRYHIKSVMRHESTKIVVSVLWHRPCKLQVPKIRILCLVTCVFMGLSRDWDLDYNMFNICVFKCDWVDSKNGVKVDELGFTLVDLSKIGHKSDPFILATQAQQVFYVEDQVDPRWSIVLSRPKMELFDIEGDET
ncbi:hypothetical protein CK203_101237 [Vitis vinifera]|uniref:Transposase-associated domain-containing protein n=1 Tax=Vitis vinifera TaxID=29760 RepID=A0A438DC62_VITVI|nr:hypothetical protein CK203_101237 [Vitis vinifera]